MQNAPPLLAFTTVALGGFRGLISNFLWIRANDLQLDDKYFEAAQLADWITDLEPHFSQVWLFQAWNMAYNISVKFKDFPDRWRWVERGIELLRDDGLRYNPGRRPDLPRTGLVLSAQDGSKPRRREHVLQTAVGRGNDAVFRPERNEFRRDLLHPQTAGTDQRAALLREKYKIDPVFAKKVDERMRSARLAAAGSARDLLGRAGSGQGEGNIPDKVKPDDLIKLRRIIYQSMLQAFHHGRIIANPFNKSYELVPDLDLVPKVNDAYEKMYAEEDPTKRATASQKAHRNFLGDAVYFLYENNRVAEAAKWYQLPRREISR